jgi:hypothetical protein
MRGCLPANRLANPTIAKAGLRARQLDSGYRARNARFCVVADQEAVHEEDQAESEVKTPQGGSQQRRVQQ